MAAEWNRTTGHVSALFVPFTEGAQRRGAEKTVFSSMSILGMIIESKVTEYVLINIYCAIISVKHFYQPLVLTEYPTPISV